jgi:hypothetical protein
LSLAMHAQFLHDAPTLRSIVLSGEDRTRRKELDA